MSEKMPVAPVAAHENPVAAEAITVGVVEDAVPYQGGGQPARGLTPITEAEVRAMRAENQRRVEESRVNFGGFFGEGTEKYLSTTDRVNYRELDYILSNGYSDEKLIDMLCAKGYQKLSKDTLANLVKASCANPQAPQKDELNSFFEKLKKAHDKVASQGEEELATLGMSVGVAVYCGLSCWICTAFMSCCIGGYVANEKYGEMKSIVQVDYVERRYIFAYYQAFGIASDLGMQEPTPSAISR